MRQFCTEIQTVGCYTAPMSWEDPNANLSAQHQPARPTGTLGSTRLLYKVASPGKQRLSPWRGSFHLGARRGEADSLIFNKPLFCSQRETGTARFTTLCCPPAPNLSPSPQKQVSGSLSQCTVGTVYTLCSIIPQYSISGEQRLPTSDTMKYEVPECQEFWNKHAGTARLQDWHSFATGQVDRRADERKGVRDGTKLLSSSCMLCNSLYRATLSIFPKMLLQWACHQTLSPKHLQ